MLAPKDELGECKFIVSIPDFSRLKSGCPHPYYPVRGDILSHSNDAVIWIYSKSIAYYRFDSFCYLCKGKKPSNFYFSKQEVLDLHRDGIIILYKKLI